MQAAAVEPSLSLPTAAKSRVRVQFVDAAQKTKAGVLEPKNWTKKMEQVRVRFVDAAQKTKTGVSEPKN